MDSVGDAVGVDAEGLAVVGDHVAGGHDLAAVWAGCGDGFGEEGGAALLVLPVVGLLLWCSGLAGRLLASWASAFGDGVGAASGVCGAVGAWADFVGWH